MQVTTKKKLLPLVSLFRWKMCDKQDNFSSVSKIYLEEVKEKIIFMGTLYFHFLPNDKPGIKEL